MFWAAVLFYFRLWSLIQGTISTNSVFLSLRFNLRRKKILSQTAKVPVMDIWGGNVDWNITCKNFMYQ